MADARIAKFLPTAILIPSLNRPHRLRELVENIHETTPLWHQIYFAVSDEESLTILDELKEFAYNDQGAIDQRYVTRNNSLVRLVDDDTKTLYFASDDVVFYPDWLENALEVMANGPSFVVNNDKRNHNGTQALITKDYLRYAVFDSPGDAFHHGYIHNFADTEQFYTAQKHGVFARAMDSIVEHLNPVFANERHLPWDETYHLSGRGWDHDRQLYEERIKLIDEAITQ